MHDALDRWAVRLTPAPFRLALTLLALTLPALTLPAAPVAAQELRFAEQRVESTEAAAASNSSSGSSRKATTSGDRYVLSAYKQSKSAQTRAEYSEIISLCQQGIRAGLSEKLEGYAPQLLGWAYNRRGELLVEQGHESIALDDFEAAVQSDPNRWRALHNRGVSYATLGRYEEAIEDFNLTLELNPRFADAFFNRGEVRYQLGQYDVAVKDYSRAIELAADEADYYNGRGHAYYRLGRVEEATRDYSMAIRYEPRHAGALTNRADLYTDTGQYEKAVGDYRAAIRANPQFARAYLSAAWLMATCPLAEFRSVEGALDALESAERAGAPRDFQFLATLAAAQANAADYKQAELTLTEAIQSAPAAATKHFYTQLGYYRQRRPFRSQPQKADSIAAQQADQPETQAGFQQAVPETVDLP